MKIDFTKLDLSDDLPEEDLLFNSFLAAPEENTIHFSRSSMNDAFKDILKAAEAFCYFCYHPDLSEEPMDLKTLLSILFLELKNELEPKKHVVQHFPSLCNKSYGESKDENIEKAREIINQFL